MVDSATDHPQLRSVRRTDIMSQTDRKFEQSHRVCLNKQGIYKHLLLCCILLLNDCHNCLISTPFIYFLLKMKKILSNALFCMI